jgi:hypothetical protein
MDLLIPRVYGNNTGYDVARRKNAPKWKFSGLRANSGFQLFGGIMRQMPYFSASGVIFRMYCLRMGGEHGSA